jgi:hypothetical protein
MTHKQTPFSPVPHWVKSRMQPTQAKPANHSSRANFSSAAACRIRRHAPPKSLYCKELLFRRILRASPHELPGRTALAKAQILQAPNGFMIVLFLLHTCNRKISEWAFMPLWPAGTVRLGRSIPMTNDLYKIAEPAPSIRLEISRTPAPPILPSNNLLRSGPY